MIMRWVLLTLLILNGGYFLYLKQVEKPIVKDSGAQVQTHDMSTNSIQLLSEAITAGQAVKVERLDPVVEQSRLQPKAQICTKIGAFPDEGAASQVQQRLMAAGIGSDIQPIRIPTASKYWVFISPLSDRRRAQQKYKQLKADGVDSYLMTDGEMANAISLGLFTKEKLALKLLEKHQRRGDDVSMKEVPKFKFEYWVHIKRDDRELFSKELWEGIKQRYQFAEKHDNLCEDGIATTQLLP